MEEFVGTFSNYIFHDREQRHIEKLRQRMEKQNHQSTCYNTNHSGPCPSSVEEENIKSFWPDLDQIQSLEIDSQLPVTAFGAPVPTFNPRYFSYAPHACKKFDVDKKA